jgi:hypothetical protein
MMAASDLIPISYLRECFDYDPETGTLRWRERPRSHFLTFKGWAMWNARYPCKQVGCLDIWTRLATKRGRIRVGLHYDDTRFVLYLHRIIWALVHGVWPNEIDHWDGDPANNRISNLRKVTRGENQQNTTARGTSDNHGRWRARIRINYELINLGMYDTEEEAHRAYLDAKRKYHLYRPVPRNSTKARRHYIERASF